MTDPKVGTGRKPAGSKRRLYTDENPADTVSIKFTTINDVKNTINKLERLYKSNKRPHKRISQIAQVLEQRLRFIKGAGDRHKLAKRYTEFLKTRTPKKEEDRKKLKFKMT
tara:strand:+ start:315 stop:647 length:333 start_codon:yes stop_codon:yes gene_type:complete